MFHDYTSCSDCKLELIEKRWTVLLLDWLNKCVNTKCLTTQLNTGNLLNIFRKYKHDINLNEMELAVISSDDVESFLKYKYPILRLRYFAEAKDVPKKIYIMTSVLLFHCCVNSVEGVVDSDIRRKLSKTEQEMILRFCERLSEMEVTANNVESAIKYACDIEDAFKTSKMKRSIGDTSSDVQPSKSSVLPTESEASSEYFKPSHANVPLEITVSEKLDKRAAILNFTSSVTVLPSAVVGTSSLTDKATDKIRKDINAKQTYQVGESGPKDLKMNSSELSMAVLMASLTIGLAVFYGIRQIDKFDGRDPMIDLRAEPLTLEQARFSSLQQNTWECKNNLCQKVYAKVTSPLYKSLSRCILLCMGPQLWPLPIGITYFSKTIVALATKKLEYKFITIQSEAVHKYLAEAFKLFLKDLVKLERIDSERNNYNDTEYFTVRRMKIHIDVQADPDPRLRVDTDEAYTLKVEAISNQVVIQITSASFCGVRHGLETLSQLILLDQSSGLLITLSQSLVQDAPSYKYRGLMLDTGRNYIPVRDIIRTVDAMSTVKLNTFHWRISDATSFPLFLRQLPQLFEYGAYNLAMAYTKDDVRSVVNRAAVRGIRVLMEVAAPGPVGRAWSWSKHASCPHKNGNFNCSNILCLRLNMHEAVFDALQAIYAEILEMTKVDDIFHLSNGLFSMTNCYNLLWDREGYLDKALARLKIANKGFMPRLPIVWYNAHLSKELESKSWDRLGVQFNDLQQNPSDQFLKRFRVIHSSRWDLSCEIKKSRCRKYRTWQDMYSWKSWKNIEVFTLEGGEALLWTDLVDSGGVCSLDLLRYNPFGLSGVPSTLEFVCKSSTTK